MCVLAVHAHMFVAFGEVDAKVIYLAIYYLRIGRRGLYLFIHDLPDITLQRKHRKQRVKLSSNIKQNDTCHWYIIHIHDNSIACVFIYSSFENT